LGVLVIVLAGQSNANHPDTLTALSDGVYPWKAIKAVWNATPLAPVREDGWHWEPRVGKCYRGLVEAVWATGLQPLWLMWVQGESDVAAGVVDEYVDRFRDFRTKIREDLFSPEMKIGIVRLRFPGLAEAQTILANDEANSILVDVDDLPFGDGTIQQQIVRLPRPPIGEVPVTTKTVVLSPPWDAISKIHFTPESAKRLGVRLASLATDHSTLVPRTSSPLYGPSWVFASEPLSPGAQFAVPKAPYRQPPSPAAPGSTRSNI